MPNHADTNRLFTDAELTAEVERLQKLTEEKVASLTPAQVEAIQELMEDANFGVQFIFEKVMEEHPKVDPRNVLSCLFLKLIEGCLQFKLTPPQLQIMLSHAVAKHERVDATVQ